MRHRQRSRFVNRSILRSVASKVQLVEYTNNAVVVWRDQERLSLDPQTYNLQLTPVRHWDHGEYICLPNDRRRPEAVIHLIVHGRKPPR